jgi:A1 cistron-splicing factor AAR2
MCVFIVDVLQGQLEECPDDFFRDILLENNFTSVMLKTLGQNIKENSETLVIRFEKLKKFIMGKFNWDIPQQNEEEEEEDDEDAPVVVEL